MRSLARFPGSALALLALFAPAAALAQGQPQFPNQYPPPFQQPASPPAQPQPAPAPAADGKTIVLGSVVQLQSGGPSMTVIALGNGMAATQWWQASANAFVRAEFPLPALKIVTASDNSADDEDEEEDDEEEENDDE